MKYKLKLQKFKVKCDGAQVPITVELISGRIWIHTICQYRQSVFASSGRPDALPISLTSIDMTVFWSQ